MSNSRRGRQSVRNGQGPPPFQAFPLPARPAASYGSSGNSNDAVQYVPSFAELQQLQLSLQRTQDASESRQRLVASAESRLTASRFGRPAVPDPAAGTKGSGKTDNNERAQTPTAGSSTLHASTNRGTKRSRLDSESSLSPTSTTSTSSIDRHANNQAAHAPNSSFRAGSPSNNALGLSSTKLSKSLSSSTSGGNAGKSTSTSSNKGKGPEIPLNAGIPPPPVPVIPGMNAPVPALPGFRKKKKGEATATPTASARASPAPSAAKDAQPEASTSKLPPPPSSLPPRPASLPPKPQSLNRRDSYQSSTSRSDYRHDRERSSGWGDDRDRDRDRGRERDRDRDRHRSTEPDRSRDKERTKYDDSRDPSDRHRENRSTLKESDRSTSVSADEDSKRRSASPLPLPKPPPATAVNAPHLLEPPKVAISSPPSDEEDALLHPEQSSNVDTASTSVDIKKSPTLTDSVPASGTGAPPIARKTLPPSAKSSPSIQQQQLPPSRPGTPLGRKNLPPSVSSNLARTASTNSLSALNAKDRSSSGAGSSGTYQNGLSIAGPPHYPGMDNRPNPTLNGISATTASSSGNTKDDSKEAKLLRKEEKKKRKLAAAGLGLPTHSNVSTPNGSPATAGRVNGSGRQDSLPPNKQRRLESSPSVSDAGQNQGLKVKLNGFTLNRSKSTTPGEAASFAHPAPPTKKTVSIPGVADDFSLPTRSLVPAVPPLVLPNATPNKQIDVDEDFDHAKPASQVPYTSFANWANDYLRSFGDDDVAFLAPRPEDPALFQVPALGAHYLDTWAAMDAEMAGETVNLPSTSTSLIPPALRRFKGENLTNEALSMENVYLGPLGERLISAFRGTNQIQSMLEELLEMPLPEPQSATIPGPDALQVSPHIPTSATFADPALAGPTIKEMDALDFESRLTRELSFLGVIPPSSSRIVTVSTSSSKKGTQEVVESSVDWGGREDDEISTSLRACQRLLRQQSAINEQRKSRLADLVKQRIAYQEFESLRDGLESVIEGAWNKRQRAAQRKAYKDKKDGHRKEKDRDKLEAASLAQSIAALNQPQALSATLIAALTKRRNLVDGFAHLFPDGGLILPASSVYESLSGGHDDSAL